MHRRKFLRTTAAVAGSAFALRNPLARSATPNPSEKQLTGYLRKIMPTRDQVDRFIRGRQGPENLSRNDGWLYDPELGWVLCDSIRGHGVDNSRGYYRYEPDGARKVVNFPDRPCRLHTYGNSFTHCDQVSDGETWQEYLAAHFLEPVRNFGVGGYGVYQAYRRLLRVEKKDPVPYLILNIWDDDHYRNIESWRAVRFGARTSCGFTLPYLKVNITENRCTPVENLLPTPEAVYQLTDLDFLRRTFRNDPILHIMAATRSSTPPTAQTVSAIAAAFGHPDSNLPDAPPAQQIRHIHTRAALFATQHIVTWTEQFAQKHDRRLMLILSFGRGNIARALRNQPPFDQTFTNWLKDKPYPVIDMRDHFRRDFQNFRLDPDAYLRRFYIGHHNPAGNFFTAWALKPRLLDWLQPKPQPYRT